MARSPTVLAVGTAGGVLLLLTVACFLSSAQAADDEENVPALFSGGHVNFTQSTFFKAKKKEKLMIVGFSATCTF
jgi:hypothetical protein